MADDTPSLFLDGAALCLNLGRTAYCGQHTEIVLQGVPKLDYTLRLFVEDWKRKLQTQDNQTWSPVAQRP